jgi:hypothetical protein
MPQRTWCSRCDYLLYEGDFLRSPGDIVKKFDGNCPLCNKKLASYRPNSTSPDTNIYRGDFITNNEGIPKKTLQRNIEREKAGSMELYNNKIKRKWERQKKRKPEE